MHWSHHSSLGTGHTIPPYALSTVYPVPPPGTPWFAGPSGGGHSMDTWSLWRWALYGHGFSGPSLSYTVTLVPLAHHGPGVCWSLWRWALYGHGFSGPSLSYTVTLVPLAHHGPGVCWSLWMWALYGPWETHPLLVQDNLLNIHLHGPGHGNLNLPPTLSALQGPWLVTGIGHSRDLGLSLELGTPGTLACLWNWALRDLGLSLELGTPETLACLWNWALQGPWLVSGIGHSRYLGLSLELGTPGT